MASESDAVQTLEVAGDWSSEANFTGSSDGNCMLETTSNSYSGEFSFGFSSVEGTIDGIAVTVKYASGDNNDYVEVGLWDGVQWNIQNVAWAIETTQCANAVERTVGGALDDWGGTWTAAHILSTDFRIRIRSKNSGKGGGSWRCDNASCTVYYTEASAEDLMVID